MSCLLSCFFFLDLTCGRKGLSHWAVPQLLTVIIDWTTLETALVIRREVKDGSVIRAICSLPWENIAHSVYFSVYDPLPWGRIHYSLPMARDFVLWLGLVIWIQLPTVFHVYNLQRHSKFPWAFLPCCLGHEKCVWAQQWRSVNRTVSWRPWRDSRARPFG